MGKVCVAGCGALEIDYANRRMMVKDTIIREGEFISIDGTTGEVLAGEIMTRPSDVVRVLIEKELDPRDSAVYETFNRLMAWSDKVRSLRVRANADQPDQSEVAIAFGAEGIGLCRTEHMFFGGDRIDAVREMILADDEAGRRRALGKLLPMQRQDFLEIFRVMKDRPVTIRTLDPPLHEFLPHADRDIDALAARMGVSRERVNYRMGQLKEFNPMLGNRGCRLGIIFPEITEMQARAIFEAACQIRKEGVDVHPEVMIPLVGFVNELREEEQIVRRVAEEVFAKAGVRVKYLVGTMIELPRAAVTADEIAGVAEFFSFGTNDLTQTTLGLSRDDSGTFLPQYLDHGIFDQDPFQTIDQKGVGVLMRFAVDRGRETRPAIKIGICGEHGGEPKSVAFCSSLGLNYVSCSPYRLPMARLAAAPLRRPGLRDAGPPSGHEVLRIEQRGHARPGNLQRRRDENRRGGVGGRHIAAKETVRQGFQPLRFGRLQPAARLLGGLRQQGGIDAVENASERGPPCGVALGRGRVEGAAAGQRAGRQTVERGVLGRHERSDHAQETFQLMAGCQFLQARGTPRKHRGEIGHTDGIAVGDLAQRVLAIGCGGGLRLLATQDSSLRTCRLPGGTICGDASTPSRRSPTRSSSRAACP